MEWELWLHGEMEEREGEWLERQMVSRHPHGKHNNRERRSDLRVTPTPLFILFLGTFRGLSPFFGLLVPFAQSLAPLGILSSVEGF